MNPTPESSSSPDPVGVQQEQSYLLVLAAGLATTGLALLGVYLLDTRTDDFHVMGWYANYVLPVGALLVGLVAASGYGLGSWFSGIKITRRLLWLVLILQLAAYFAAQYIEFKNLMLVHQNGEPVGFFEYYDFVARSFAWKKSNGESGDPLGVWGYFFRGLEILGFLLGGLIVPLILRKAPYCQACQRYMRTRQLALVPASVPAKKVKKADVAGLAAQEAEQQQAFEGGQRTIESLQQLAAGNKSHDFLKILADLRPLRKKTASLPARFNLELIHCRRCHVGSLVAQLFLGQGQHIKHSEFGRTSLHPEFVRALAEDSPGR
jgi:hypothetical protein